MTLDQIPDKAWLAVVEGGAQLHCEFLALSFLVSNLKQRRRTQNPPTADIVREFKTFFTKYGSLPAAQRDLAKIAQL